MGLFIFCSCEKEDDILYQEEARVNFGCIENQEYYSLALYFGDKPFDEQEISCKIPVTLMGHMSDKDRTFKVSIDTASTAPASTYQPLAENYTFKANSIEDSVTITFNRLKIQGENSYSLVLKFDEAGELKPGAIESNTFTVTYSNYLEKPSWWDMLSTELGFYQQEKYQKYLEINKEPLSYWEVYLNRYEVLRKWKPVREFFDNHPEYGVVFPGVSWGV
jgi:hypothetical protein